MKFTVEQTARGLATTWARGDYSLTMQRLRAVPKEQRAQVKNALKKQVPLDERDMLERYWGRK